MNEAGILNELRRQAAELAEIRFTCDDLARQLLKAKDRKTGAALLPLAAELVGDAAFDQAELLTAAFEARSATGVAVMELAQEIGAGAGDDVPKSFGWLLSRLSGVALNGYRLIPEGKRRDIRRWRLVRVSGEENPQD